MAFCCQIPGIHKERQAILIILGKFYKSKEIDPSQDIGIINLFKTSLCGADLRWAILQGADLMKADLCGADLMKADLRWANLREADLREADLREADLKEANLMKADLCGADLMKADLRWANLKEADLKKADLDGAKLIGAKEITAEQIKSAKNWEKAIYSDDLKIQLGLATAPKEREEKPEE